MLEPVAEPLMTRMLAFSRADCPELAQSLLQRKERRGPGGRKRQRRLQGVQLQRESSPELTVVALSVSVWPCAGRRSCYDGLSERESVLNWWWEHVVCSHVVEGPVRDL